MTSKKYHLLFLVVLIGILVQGLFAQDDNTYINKSSDSVVFPRTINSDSIITDSINDIIIDSVSNQSDSTLLQKETNAIDAPIDFSAKDSIVMTMDGRSLIHLIGEASVGYKDLNIDGEYLEVDTDSSTVFATYGLDSLNVEYGYPLFKDGDTSYEMKKARYNFKTKKMFVNNVITQQGEGFLTAGETKKMPNDDMYMRNGRYSTCDEHDHQHFYLQLTKAKVQPGKRVITGPAYLVVEDVPLPIALPFGFFPFSSDYSSGVIMPTYGDELSRGFSLRDGGYYFAFNDYVDLAVTGEIFTKGSWGLDARSSYRKRYKFNGNFQASYRVTKTGEDKRDPDYKKQTDMMIKWSHSQDAKANPFNSFSANVNFSTSSYSRNDISSIYSNDYTQNTKSSSINYSLRPPNSPFSFNMNASINQVSRDTTIGITFPNMTISMRDVYPFRRKEIVGSLKWYENIRLSYSGALSNSITAKENEIFKKNIIKDWRNAMQHNIPISASFNLFKNISITASVNYNERWYTSAINKEYDYSKRQTVAVDTTYSFYRIYDYSASISANTKLYGMYKPWGGFGEWAKKTQIRHVLSPSVTFTGAPDFGDSRYGFWQKLNYIDSDGNVEETYYSPYEHNIYGVPSRGKRGNLSFSVDNNIEMKVPIADTDSTKKISLIDQFKFSSGYNFLADSLNWNNINANLRIKFGSAYTLSLQGQFDVYLYDTKGRPINKLRIANGKGLGRLRSTGTSFSYSINNSTIKNLFSKNKEKDIITSATEGDSSLSDIEQDNAIAAEDAVDAAKRTSLRQAKNVDTNYDDDGYYISSIPWNLNLSYSLSVGYDLRNFNSEKREYPYTTTQSLGISGNITPAKNWNFSFNTNYDFDAKKFVTMQCSISRQMHCWQMSASIIPLGPYQSYTFTIAVSSSLLRDIKYTQSSNYRDSKYWGE
ncbi:hypothetical protein M2138_000195 [Dysgonomonadaceae bacterium PH5-43]|nr:hypothetical protein [Dysgonomonadaceae bacterium PH5-43]